MRLSVLATVLCADIPTGVDSSPAQALSIKRAREHDDFPQEAGRPAPLAPKCEITTADPSVLAINRPGVELSLMRTTSVPRNQTGVVEARLEWVVTKECPHPRDIEVQRNW